MDRYYLMLSTTWGSLVLACGSALVNYRRLDKAARIFALLMAFTLAEEIISFYAAWKYRNNIPVMRIFSVVEIVTVCLYFNYSNEAFRKKNAGYIIALVSLFVGIADLALSKNLHTFSYFFMSYEAVVIIVMAFITQYLFISRHEYLAIATAPHFWLAAILAFFWSITAVNWILYDVFTDMLPGKKWLIDYFIFLVNIIMHLAIAVVFLRFPKKTDRNA